MVMHSNAAARFSRAANCGGGNGKAFSNRGANIFKLKLRLATDYIILRSSWVMPGAQFASVTDSGSAEASYYTWVDQFDTFGLGKNVPIATGNENESLLALVDGKFVNLRVPYPLGYYTKWMDGRIDDANAGWRGKGIWSTFSTRAMVHVEGGKGTRPKVVKFQLRPDPLAR